MKNIQKNVFVLLLIGFGFIACSSENNHTELEKAKIADLLNEFLSGAADNAEIHDRFWSEDLIYTSSAGLRFGKDQIMDGFADQGEENESNDSEISYHAEDLEIRMYDQTAILAFTLVATTPDDTSRFLNSGTLEKQDGDWKVILWQATRKAESE